MDSEFISLQGRSGSELTNWIQEVIVQKIPEYFYLGFMPEPFFLTYTIIRLLL